MKILWFLLISLASFGQQLRVGSVIPTDLPNMEEGIVWEHVKTAPSGALFRYQNDPYVRYLSYDGKSVRMDPENIPAEFKPHGIGVADFTADDRYVYMLANVDFQKEPTETVACTISRFDLHDGRYLDSHKLEQRQHGCLKLSAFGDDQVFVATIYSENGVSRSKNLIFKTNGQFVNELTFAGDMKVKDKKQKKLADLSDDKTRFLMMGTSFMDWDGREMVVSRRVFSQPDVAPFVMIVKPGQGSRRVELDPPETVNGKLYTVRLIAGKLVTLYAEKGPKDQHFTGVVKVYSLSGKVLHRYTYDTRDFGAVLIDWDDRRGVFMTKDPADDRKLALIEALP